MDPALPPWGKSVAINLFDCEKALLQDPDHIRSYITKVIKHIHMKAHGEMKLERFGHGDLEGYSAMQFIETSSITLHADEVRNRCFVDIFSCKDFDANDAAEYTRKYFHGKSMTQVTLVR